MAHTWQPKFFLHTSTVAIPWRPTHMLPSLNYFKTRPTSTKFNNNFLHTWPLAGSVLFVNYFFFFSGLLDYNTNKTKYQYKKQFNEAQRGEISKIVKPQSQMMKALCLWTAHLKHWSSTTITPTPTRLPARS